MEVLIDQLGKQFDQRFVFRNINYHIKEGVHLGLRGLNGCGKSTFLAILSQDRLPTEGSVSFLLNSKEVDMKRYAHIHIAAMGPYLRFPGNFTVSKLVSLYEQHKLKEGVSGRDILELAELERFADNKFDTLSSGMQQRLKIFLSLYSKADLFLFDEPGNFLDDHWRQVIFDKMAFVLQDKTVITASNDSRDFTLCNEFINLNRKSATWVE